MHTDVSARTMALEPDMDASAETLSFGMRELADHEVESVSGGNAMIIAGILVLFVAGVAYGSIKAHREHCG